MKLQHVKPGKGPAFVRTTIKNVLSGKIVDKTFNAGLKVEPATVDRRAKQKQAELMEEVSQSAAADEAAAESVAE